MNLRPRKRFVQVDRPAAELSGVRPGAPEPGAERWAAIDFETANHESNSACALGVAFVDEGQVSGTFYSLIRPPRMDFVPRFVDIHGIDPEQVESAPTFAQVWEQVAELMAGRTMLAHNASFDKGVLRACLDHYAITQPGYRFGCTVQLARAVWPGSATYKLSAVAERLAIPLEHHQAESDAIASARIGLEALKETGLASLDEVVKKTRFRFSAL
ncbi:MAG TPA: 3'-5' exonuclease [Chloroflexota bacterium]|nr:3'-5' exonuclease [Chloroflexota bacterium]